MTTESHSKVPSIDLRSDTVTRPTAAMRRAMAEALVGDDVYGEDPTVNRLEAMAAERLGKEAALFTTSGTQANLLALLCHCGRGDEYLAGRSAHTYFWEGGGASVLGGVQANTLPVEADGTLDLSEVRRQTKPIDDHFVRSRLLCLENTSEGRALPLDYLDEASATARDLGLAIHLDGARLWNAAIAGGVEPSRIAAPFDSVAVCLSKGLCAPVGSLVAGPRDLVTEARRWRKTLGGGMRQAGVLAAAGIVALEQQIDRLHEDHAHAEELAAELDKVAGFDVRVATNMVFLDAGVERSRSLLEGLRQRGVLVDYRTHLQETLRVVFHADIDRGAFERARKAFAEVVDTVDSDRPLTVSHEVPAR